METLFGFTQAAYQGSPISACLPVVGSSSACQWAEGRGNFVNFTRDTNGDEVLVWANFNDAALTTPCTAGVTKIRLADAKQTCIWKGDWGEAVHVSGTDNSGWAFVEAYSSRDLNPSTDWTAYQGELLQVKLDGTEVRRLAHHRSRPFPGNDYCYSPKMSASRDGTKVSFALRGVRFSSPRQGAWPPPLPGRPAARPHP